MQHFEPRTPITAKAPASASLEPPRRIEVAFICATWCATCREFLPQVQRLADANPHVGFLALDVEADADLLGDVDVDDFPTLVVAHPRGVLYYGTTLPQVPVVQRLLDDLLGRDAAPLDSAEAQALAQRIRAADNDG